MMGNARHGVVLPFGQSETANFGGILSILVEHLIEIPEPEE